MDIFLLIITLFPSIVALILRGTYYKPALGLAVINGTVIIVTQEHSRSATTGHLIVIYALNVMVACVVWYLAFKRKTDKLVSSSKEDARRFLTATGWIIVLAIIVLIAAFAYALSAA